jgi:predicted amidohydrolase
MRVACLQLGPPLREPTAERTRAVSERKVFLVACNGAGEDHGKRLAGTSLIADAWGDVVARAGDGEETLEADIDPGRVQAGRRKFPALADRRLAVGGEVASLAR